MFYVVDSKIYFCESNNTFSEVVLKIDSDGFYFFEKTGKILSKKPTKRIVMSKEEIIARLGRTAVVEAEAEAEENN